MKILKVVKTQVGERVNQKTGRRKPIMYYAAVVDADTFRELVDHAVKDYPDETREKTRKAVIEQASMPHMCEEDNPEFYKMIGIDPKDDFSLAGVIVEGMGPRLLAYVGAEKQAREERKDRIKEVMSDLLGTMSHSENVH